MPVPVARPGTPRAAVHLADGDIHLVATTIVMLHVEHYVELPVNGTKHQKHREGCLGALVPPSGQRVSHAPNVIGLEVRFTSSVIHRILLANLLNVPHQYCNAVDVLGLQLSGLDPLCSARNSPGVYLPRMTSRMFTSAVGILEFLILPTACTSLYKPVDSLIKVRGGSLLTVGLLLMVVCLRRTLSLCLAAVLITLHLPIMLLCVPLSPDQTPVQLGELGSSFLNFSDKNGVIPQEEKNPINFSDRSAESEAYRDGGLQGRGQLRYGFAPDSSVFH
jgi:hypothetical protein